MRRLTHALLVMALATSSSVRAQLIFEHITPADGLPSDQVLALHEDRNGFIWIGTDGGLARHEGVRIRTWHHDRKDPRSLANNVVWDINADEHGTVWIATDHGLCAYDERRGDFDRVLVTRAYHDHTSANRIHRIMPDGHGRLWLATEDGVHVISLDHRREIPLSIFGEGSQRLTFKTARFELERDTVHQGVWISAKRGNLFFDAKGARFITAKSVEVPFDCLEDTLAQNLTPDGQGGVWYYTSSTKQLCHADRTGRTIHGQAVPSTNERIANPQFIRIDRAGFVWFSTWGHQFFRYDPRTETWLRIEPRKDEPWSILNANAKSWIEDRDGRIWIGTIEGLDVIDPERKDIRLYLIRTEPEVSEVSLIEAVSDNLVIIGSEGQGVVFLDRASGTQRALRATTAEKGPVYLRWKNFPLCISPDQQGWLVGTHNGLMRLDPLALHYDRARDITGKAPEFLDGRITFIQPDGFGKRWMGTWDDGLFVLDTLGRVVPFTLSDGTRLPSRMPLSCATGPEGTWFGFNNGGGLCRVKDGSVVERLLDRQDSTGAGYGVVLSLARDNDGTLYIGTLMGGLGVRTVSDASITWFTRSDGLTGDRVEQLVLDRDHGLWIRTNDGLNRFDRSTRAIDRITLPTSMRTTGSLNGIALDTDGSLLCANGPLLMDIPTAAPAQRSGPPVLLTGLQRGGHHVAAWPSDSVIELRHDQRALAIEYGVRTFFSGQEIRFAYRVVDMDTAWSNLGTSTRLDLNDLPPGSHRVQVRANNGGSAWTEHPLSLSVRVLPPFWATWWFRGGLLVGIGAALYFFVRGYVNERLREQRERLEREQAVLTERMRIAGDMHDDLGAGLSALKLRSEMALRVEKDPLKREQLGALASTAGDLIGSMRQIIWTMNTDQSSLADLVSYTTNYTRSYCEQNGLTPEIITAKEWPSVQLTSEQRRNTFLVVKEALHNVVKHANARNVRLVMSHGDPHLLVDVQDDGIGLPGHTQDSVGNGLRNMRKRILALGGTLDTESSMGLPGDLQGTRIRFSVPLHRPDSNQGSIGAKDGAADLRPR